MQPIMSDKQKADNEKFGEAKRHINVVCISSRTGREMMDNINIFDLPAEHIKTELRITIEQIGAMELRLRLAKENIQELLHERD